MVLRDVMFEKMNLEQWSLNVRPRVNGALNLHNALSSTPLDFFLMLSSLSGFSGNPGQAAYAASNTFLDTFASYRTSLGLPAGVIYIGVVQGIGYVAENSDRHYDISRAAHDSLTEAELLSLLKAHITGAFGQGPRDQQTITGAKLDRDRQLPVWASDPRFAHVLAQVQSQTVSNDDSATSDDFAMRETIRYSSTEETAIKAIEDAFCRKLSNLLLISAEEVDRKKPIVAYGLDSLVAVELRNWIGRELEAAVPLMEIMNSPSIGHLVGNIAKKTRLAGEAWRGKAE